MAELADALDLGSSGRPWGFKSLYPHQRVLKRTKRFVVELFLFKITKGLELRRKLLFAISRRVNSGHPLFIGYGRTGESLFIRTILNLN